MRSLLGGVGEIVARTPVPFVRSNAGGSSQPAAAPSGTAAELAMARTNSTVFAMSQRSYDAVGSACWRLYRLPRPGSTAERREYTRPHPARDVFTRNRFIGRRLLLEIATMHLDLTGKSAIVVEKEAQTGLPFRLWPVRPDRLLAIPDPEEFIAGYVYVGPGGEKVPLEVDEVLRTYLPNPEDPYDGLGPGQAAAVDLRANAVAAQWNLNFFTNSAEPGGLLEVERELKDAEFNKLRDRWREQHQGVARAHRVAILEGGLKWVNRSMSLRDMQFNELRAGARETVREAWGFPKPMLGGTEDVNKAAANAAQVMFARWHVDPRLSRFRGTFNDQLMPLFGSLGERFAWDYDNPVPEDREDDDRERTSKTTAVSQLVAAGAYLPDALEAYGLPPMRLAADVAAEADPAEEEPGDGDPTAAAVAVADMLRRALT